MTAQKSMAKLALRETGGGSRVHTANTPALFESLVTLGATEAMTEDLLPL